METQTADNWTVAYLGLGSSLSCRRRNLATALQRLSQTGLRVAQVSPLYESPHMGLEPGDAERYPPHLNAVVAVETVLSPHALLRAVQSVEDAGGRARDARWGPRTIDIDILLYDDTALLDERLAIPHPRLAERLFVLRPLADLASGLRLPDGRAIFDLLEAPSVQRQTVTRVADAGWADTEASA